MIEQRRVSDGLLVLDTEHESIVSELGLTSVARAFEPDFARLLRSLPDRDNGVVASSAGILFLKRHHYAQAHAQGTFEWENSLKLAGAGIPVAEPVCAGVDFGGAGRSFLLTVGIEGEPLDDFLRRGHPGEPMMREIVDELAAVTARLHAAGLCHRDYYLCHVFVQPGRAAGERLALIDLQRVMPLGRLRPTRWRLKDLAALGWSAVGLPVSDLSRCRFLLGYAGALAARAGGRRTRRQLARALLRQLEPRIAGRLRRHGEPQPPEPRDPELRWNPEAES